MYTKLMVPVDLERLDKLEKALQTAAELAKHYGAPVCYVAVAGRVPNQVATSPEQFEVELNLFAREQAERHGIATSGLMIPSVDVSAELEHKLVRTIDELGADLVVMASHIPGLADRLHLLPSNAAYIVKHTGASVFVVR